MNFRFIFHRSNAIRNNTDHRYWASHVLPRKWHLLGEKGQVEQSCKAEVGRWLPDSTVLPNSSRVACRALQLLKTEQTIQILFHDMIPACNLTRGWVGRHVKRWVLWFPFWGQSPVCSQDLPVMEQAGTWPSLEIGRREIREPILSFYRWKPEARRVQGPKPASDRLKIISWSHNSHSSVLFRLQRLW